MFEAVVNYGTNLFSVCLASGLLSAGAGILGSLGSGFATLYGLKKLDEKFHLNIFRKGEKIAKEI